MNEIINEMHMIEEMSVDQTFSNNVSNGLTKVAKSAISIVSSETEQKRASVD